MSPHPSMLLFDDAWRITLARQAPWLLLVLVRESRRYYQRNMMWLRLQWLAERLYGMAPPRMVLAP